MKILCRCTESGLVPMYESDLDSKRRLTLGADYWCEIKLARNYEFHKKFFALIKLAYDNLPECLDRRYPNMEALREDLLIRCGYTRKVLSRQGVVEVAASIAFEKLDQTAFEELYRKVWNEINKCFLPLNDVEDSIEEELIRFL